MTACKARFDLYVKAGADGVCFGDCPFSQRCYMFMLLHVPQEKFQIITVDTSNKPAEFLQLNPDGKVPVLVDHGADADDKVIDDSSRINAYINELYPSEDAKCAYQGPAADACGGIFPKLAQLSKNRDTSKTPQLKQALLEELVKFNAYLCCDEHKGKKFLLGDCLSDLDCSVLPKLLHVQVAGKEFKGFEIPQELTALHEYINNGSMEAVWKKTCPADEQIIHGWSKHNVLKET